MALKLFATLALLVVTVSALPPAYHEVQGIKGGDVQISGYEGQGEEGGHGHYDEDNYGPAEYQFKYGVHDEHTGDIKSQEEVRKGDVVHGRYELIDSDGYRRIVEYTADDHNGFQAVVRREPTDIKIPVPEQHHYAAPEQHHYAAPEEHHYAAPEESYGSKGVYYVSSTAAPLEHYSPSDYGVSGHGYSAGQEDEDDGSSGKYQH